MQGSWQRKGGLRRVPPGAGADAGAADPQGERGLSAGAGRTEPADHRAAARGKIAMAHRAATDEICVTGGMGNAPSSKRRGLVRVSAWCLLAPKDLACHVCREPHITRGERCSLFTCGSQNKQGKRIVTRALSQSLCKIRFYNRTMLISIDETCSRSEESGLSYPIP